MNRYEFEAHIETTVSADEYKVIEMVYTWHPSISGVNGKNEIAAIYKLPGGMRIIRDMLPTAKARADLEIELTAAAAELERARAARDAVREKIAALTTGV